MARAALPLTVLIVEDESLISHLVADWLYDRGFAVHEAASGDEALAYIDDGGPVDVMFTDINLPGSIDGARAADARARAAAGAADRLCFGPLQCRRDRALVSRSVFVPKPYDPADVCTLLQRLTSRAH